jgi:predicted Zn-dependent protease with MMP-like domain
MSLKPKTYPILVDAVENGVKYGYHRAHKHNDNPDQEQITDAVIAAVLHEIFEWFDIDDGLQTNDDVL